MTNSTNCIIIDDEPLARSLIRALLLKKTDFSITGECTNPTEAYELLLNNSIDVIFLDIQMPVISGIEFLSSLKKPPKIIFTTAHSNFAAGAFDLNAVDYLVKPITEERFEQAIKKLKSAFAANQHINTSKEDQSPSVDYIFFKTDGKLVKIRFDQIVYLEALKDYTKIHLNNDKFFLVGEHLKAVESSLPDNLFLRTHRSFVVSLKAISGIFGNTVEVGKKQLPLGNIYKNQLFQSLNIYK